MFMTLHTRASHSTYTYLCFLVILVKTIYLLHSDHYLGPRYYIKKTIQNFVLLLCTSTNTDNKVSRNFNLDFGIMNQF